MKKILPILLLTVFSFNFSTAQHTISETEKLALTGKIWGFLKYYHPQVADGKFNWDDQLIRLLPKIEKVNDKESLSKIYLDWINALGEIKKCKSCAKENNQDYFNKNFNLSWTQDSFYFTSKLSEKLKFIEDNRFQGKSHYVAVHKNVENIKIINEPKYEDFEYPNENYRLLCLFRHWNIIEYFFPYKYLTDQNWDSVLEEMIEKFKYAKNSTSYHLALLELSAKTDDSHTRLLYTKQLGGFFGNLGLPINYQIIDNKAVIIGFSHLGIAETNDLKIGDALIEVDGVSIVELLESKSKYIPASNLKGKYKKYDPFLFLGKNKKTTLKLERKGIVVEKVVNRYDYSTLKRNIVANDSTKWKKIKNNIGYVNMKNVKGNEAEKMMKSLLDCKTIIFDIRNYPNNISRRVSRHLNPEQREFVKITKPNLSYPGKFIWKETKTAGIKNKDYYKGKVILLVNGNTMSRAEYTVKSFQTAPNVTTIGNQTSGTDGTVSIFEFIGGYKTSMTSLGIYYPDYSETQRVGVKIDIEVNPTVEGIIQGRDEILEKAIELASK